MNYEAKLDMSEDAGSVHGYDPLAEDDAGGRSARRWLWIIVAVIGVAVVGLWFLSRGDDEAQFAAATDEQIPAVTVVSPGRSTISGRISATGTIGARRELPVGASGESGAVDRVLVDAGDWVGKGEVLAVIDRSVQSQQIASLAAQVDVAQADARLAQANLDRALKLVDRGFISTADVDRLTATRDAQAARVKVAKAQLGELQARTRRLNILAPEAGYVLERNIEPGQVVGPGSGILFRIAKGGEMELRARVSEDDIAKLSVGVKAEVTPVGSGKTFTGQIWQLSPTIDETNRQGLARIALSYSPELRPGGFASAEIASGSIVAPMLPESAILSDDDGSFVYVLGKDNKVVRRAVKTGIVTADGISVVEGLNGSERVVLRAGGFLNPGDVIDPQLVRPKG
ncbi:efflux RND transporter periplasmic adaptor subunit [Novosphingobium aquimarinum]|uniref:efflux RND transporter periplasmic adaptor subunit n=1 Tax=Novosphingobium aquimarinum TaxID=2682494 RepID=UPI0012EC7E7D|nr:efflux RND transporter periplasmic adaptor subunit [Novosphingobium aquimarinum]